MKINSMIRGLGLIVFAGAAMSASAAFIPPTCSANTLAFYESQGGCVFDGKSWSFGTYSFQSGGNDAVDTTANIFLTPIAGGFTFSQVDANLNQTVFNVTAGNNAYYDIIYFDPSPLQSSASLDMDPPSGDVIVNQFYCAGVTAIPTFDGVNNPPFCRDDAGAPVQSQELTVTPGSPNDDNVPLSPQFTNAFLVTQILLGSQGGNGQFDSVSASTSGAPEPVSVLLVGGGLLGLAIRRRLTRA